VGLIEMDNRDLIYIDSFIWVVGLSKSGALLRVKATLVVAVMRVSVSKSRFCIRSDFSL